MFSFPWGSARSVLGKAWAPLGHHWRGPCDPGPSWAGPLWAHLVSRALMGPLGPSRPGPCAPPWSPMGQAFAGPPRGPLRGRPLVGTPQGTVFIHYIYTQMYIYINIYTL